MLIGAIQASHSGGCFPFPAEAEGGAAEVEKNEAASISGRVFISRAKLAQHACRPVGMSCRRARYYPVWWFFLLVTEETRDEVKNHDDQPMRRFVTIVIREVASLS